ncbi:MAG: HD domain-containing protein [Candidatus Aminicenantes bacterium]|nr:HD domain-containing protein [Candidatus Aminicenantes bacterium]NIM81799.1 HD domain-containing protein [Candidatus Aminicenantes bacterium]NIN21171.1 HD domain-containing protein [Candidatus Aminicenantes bacterium]NIN44995.1 HD domain-containing protein [Candidatus Aminicenantes bacterium]NIN87809.1 HD domain-containing protein [Candidatus Aminicenantes bacterium]
MNLKGLNIPLMDFFVRVFQENVYLVGGTIRDYILYSEIKEKRDIDLVVIGHTYEEIEKKLRKHGKTNTVGKSFAVVKFSKDGMTIDISIPRKDVKKDSNSHGHKNFLIEYGPHIKLEEDLKRRDFTCNSIAMRLKDHEIVDPFAGMRAIEEKRIVMTGPETFMDDPLRILRAARFASVHRFFIDEDIYIRAKDVKLDELSKERITEELFRLLLESEKPSIGLTEYFKLAVLEKLFPPLYPLTLTIQDAIFHPEKDEYGHHTVWFHTLLTLDIAKILSVKFDLDEERALALLLGVLFHDVGKPVTTKWEYKRGRMTVTSMFHDSRGVEITDEFLTDFKIETRKNFPLKQTVLNLVKYHHRIYDLFRNREDIGFRAISRLVKDLEDQDLLLLLLDFADRQSREPNPMDVRDIDDICKWYLQKKEEYKINQETIQPIIMGRDLLKLGIPPGVQMGVYLKELYERQLDGEFDTKEEGLKVFEMIREKQ